VHHLLTDWKDLCDKKKEFDYSYFAALFTLDLTQDMLEGIFASFPNSDALVQRMRTVREAGELVNRPYLFPRLQNRGSVNELLDLVSKDLSERRRLCAQKGDTALTGIIDKAKVIYSDDEEVIDKAIRSTDTPNVWLYELIGDYLRENRIVNDDRIYALFDAFYGLAADYYLSWYLATPLISVDIDFSNYFELWRLGGAYILLEDAVIVRHVSMLNPSV